mmetsp:Transcript_124635/g.295770  ORF Transcript_124635/g.295770 Transcript_124635/m.295770 type:complete len:211 (+) Transcript_124635:1734-2366(+)
MTRTISFASSTRGTTPPPDVTRLSRSKRCNKVLLPVAGLPQTSTVRPCTAPASRTLLERGAMSCRSFCQACSCPSRLSSLTPSKSLSLASAELLLPSSALSESSADSSAEATGRTAKVSASTSIHRVERASGIWLWRIHRSWLNLCAHASYRASLSFAGEWFSSLRLTFCLRFCPLGSSIRSSWRLPTLTLSTSASIHSPAKITSCCDCA